MNRFLLGLLLVLPTCLGLSAEGGFSYIAAHVPPDNAWVSQIQIVNPNEREVHVTARTFEAGESGAFSQIQTIDFNLAAGAATTFTPPGTRQRWVKFESDRPLSGVGFFSRTLDLAGQAKTGIPLFRAENLGRSLVIPHIPSNRESFFSGAVLLNPNEVSANLSFRFYSHQGNLLNVAVADAPQTLGPQEKWVNTLSGDGVVKGLFDDEEGTEKVSYVVVDSDVDLAAFELFGTLGGEASAISGIKALPNRGRTSYRVRTSLTDVSFNGFSILNPGETEAQLRVTLLASSGESLGTTDLTLAPHLKKLGLNHVDSGFQFPFREEAGIRLADGREAASVLISSDRELRIFELAGDGAEMLDGGVPADLTSRVSFPKPEGTLNLFKADTAGRLTVTSQTAAGAVIQSHDLAANASLELRLDADLESVGVTGHDFTASVFTRGESGALTIVNGAAVAADPGSGLPEAALQALLNDIVAGDSAPGAVILVETPSGRWVGAAGFANLSNNRVLQPDDGLRIGSTTKTFVACVMLKLVEEGLLALDDPMADYLSADIVNRIEFGNQVTIRHLLGMTSGIFNYTDSDPFNDAVAADPSRGGYSAEEILAYVYNETAYFPPGSDWEYSNTNYVLLEKIVEEVSGTSLAAEMRRIIHEPLGLTSIFMEIREAREGGFGGLQVRGYDEGEDITQINDALGFGDGGLISNAADVATFATALFRHKSLLRESSLWEMRSFHPTSQYGLGIETRATAYGEAWAHDGSTGGFQGDMVYLPERETTFVYITNDFNTSIGETLFEGAMKLLFD